MTSYTRNKTVIGDVYKQNTKEHKGLPARKSASLKAPRGNPFGEVVKVIDLVKKAFAQSIGLQIDGIDQ
jgi:hypothetical protein